MKIEYVGNIQLVRAIEDSIRASKKYTKILFRRNGQTPMQGEGFPSRCVTEHYEVYPDIDGVSWDMPVGVALEWLSGIVTSVEVMFKYNYNVNKAWMVVKDGYQGVRELKKGIVGFREALSKVATNAGDN